MAPYSPALWQNIFRVGVNGAEGSYSRAALSRWNIKCRRSPESHDQMSSSDSSNHGKERAEMAARDWFPLLGAACGSDLTSDFKRIRRRLWNISAMLALCFVSFFCFVCFLFLPQRKKLLFRPKFYQIMWDVWKNNKQEPPSLMVWNQFSGKKSHIFPWSNNIKITAFKCIQRCRAVNTRMSINVSTSMCNYAQIKHCHLSCSISFMNCISGY